MDSPAVSTLSTVPTVASGAHVTLHYRLAVVVDEALREVVSTFDAQPATLTIGAGDLAPALEQRLLGLAEGARCSFDIAADESFGPRNDELVQSVSAATFAANTDAHESCMPGDMVAFTSPDGLRFSGVVRQRDAQQVQVDFNHPLAGLPLRFDVQIIGVL